MTIYKTIDDLPAGSVSLTDQLEVSQSGTSRRVPVGQLGALLTAPAGGMSVKDFGAVGNGIADDSAAILAAYAAALASHQALYFPGGTYLCLSALTFGAANNVTIRGDGSASTYIIYGGANTTVDCFTFGAAGRQLINWNLSGLTFRSNTTMTTGVGVHIYQLCRSTLDDVTVDGQDGTGKFWHGVWFDGADEINWVNFEARASHDIVQVNGIIAGAQAGLLLDNYKIGGGTVGLRCGGAFGGLYLGTGDIIGNSSHGLVIDMTLQAQANREVIVSALCSVDSNGGDGVRIDQSTSSQLYVDLGGWIASSTGNGINIVNASGAKINIQSYLYNNHGDGLRVSDASTFIYCSSYFNGNVGWGINPTVANSLGLGTNYFAASGTGDINYANATPVTNLANVTLTGVLTGTSATLSGNVSTPQYRISNTTVMQQGVASYTTIGNPVDGGLGLYIGQTNNFYKATTHTFQDSGSNSLIVLTTSSAQSNIPLTTMATTAIGAGSASQALIKGSSTANFGIFYGSGAPTFAAAANSLYMRSDGNSTTTRMYVNTTGSTTWATVTTSA